MQDGSTQLEIKNNKKLKAYQVGANLILLISDMLCPVLIPSHLCRIAPNSNQEDSAPEVKRKAKVKQLEAQISFFQLKQTDHPHTELFLIFPRNL